MGEKQTKKEEAKILEGQRKKEETKKLEDQRKEEGAKNLEDQRKKEEAKKLEEQRKKEDDLIGAKPSAENIKQVQSEDLKHQNQTKRQEEYLEKMRQNEVDKKKNIKSMFENISSPVSKDNDSPAFKRKVSKKEVLNNGDDSLQSDLKVLSEVKKQTELLMSQHKKANQEKSKVANTMKKQNASVVEKSDDFIVESKKLTHNSPVDINNGKEE